MPHSPEDSREILDLTRRDFLLSTSRGVGGLALASLLQKDGLLAAESNLPQPLHPDSPHHEPRIKNCIFIYMEGGVSQLDLFDPKPKLKELNGQKLPDSLTQNIRFAFIQKDSATLLGSPYEFKKRGQSGLEISELLPHLATCADDLVMVRSMHTEAFNHHPGELLMYTGFQMPGRPSLGAWVPYALGSPNQNLPGYVVLVSGRAPSGGNSMFGSGFLPSTYAGVLFQNQGPPVLDLANPPGITPEMRHLGLDTLRDLNGFRQKVVGDPEIASRIAAYELAARMQTSAPELTDLTGETKSTLEAYGVNRKANGRRTIRGGGPSAFPTFARNCLLARRMVERGVRFVSLHHASWDQHNDLDLDLPFNCQVTDQPIAALIKDLKDRGLLDSTLVVWASEFGRTPLGENRSSFGGRISGRDHHPFAFTMWLAGGGVRGGTVYGQTDELGWNVEKDPAHVNDFHATILHLFGLDHEKLTYRYQGRDFRLTDVGGHVVKPILA